MIYYTILYDNILYSPAASPPRDRAPSSGDELARGKRLHAGPRKSERLAENACPFPPEMFKGMHHDGGKTLHDF